MSSNSLDKMVTGFSAAVADIRQKVVEEPWFRATEGRTVTPDFDMQKDFYGVDAKAPAATEINVDLSAQLNFLAVYGEDLGWKSPDAGSPTIDAPRIEAPTIDAPDAGRMDRGIDP